MAGASCYAVRMLMLTDVEQVMLMNDLAARIGTGAQIAAMYGLSIEELTAFVEMNRSKLETLRDEIAADEAAHTVPVSEVTPQQLDDLWIANKFQRLKRLQAVAEKMYPFAHTSAMEAREFRSYMTAAATELGQLLNRGAGEGNGDEGLSVDIVGVNTEELM